MAGLHVVAPWQSALFAHTRVQTAPTAPPKLVHDASQPPWPMSLFVVFGAQPQSECTEHGREQMPPLAQYPDDSDAHWLLFEHGAPTVLDAPPEHATITTATRPNETHLRMSAS